MTLPPASFSTGNITGDACLPKENSFPDSSYPEQTAAWHLPRGVQGDPCSPGLAGTPHGAKTEL